MISLPCKVFLALSLLVLLLFGHQCMFFYGEKMYLKGVYDATRLKLITPEDSTDEKAE